MKRKALFLLPATILVTLIAFVPKMSNQSPWIVPDEAKATVNPLKDDAPSVATGKTLYNQHCKSCHGITGKGDGPKAAQLDTECPDFTIAAYQNQTDGSLFYKTMEGREEMPGYKTKIPDANDVWAIINYTRTLK